MPQRRFRRGFSARVIAGAAMIFAALGVHVAADAAPATYFYFNDFETNTPGAPAGWSGSSVDEVPSGYAGISAGPHGGGAFLNSTGGDLAFASSTGLATGTFSYQVDFYTDPSNSSLSRFITPFTRQDEPPAFLASGTYLLHFGSTFRVRDYYSAFNTPELAPGTWYTLECYYDYSTDINPSTGRPRVLQVLNLYSQASLDAAGYRHSDNLIATHSVVYPNYDSGPTPDAGDTMFPVGMNLGDNTPFYLDNVGVGPIINGLIKGDWDLSGEVTNADIQAMLDALVDLDGYKAAHELSDAELLLVGDIDDNGAVSNADIQAMLDDLTGGGGLAEIQALSLEVFGDAHVLDQHATHVPEPASAVILAMAGACLLVRHRR
jgi:hypothetical protein